MADAQGYDCSKSPRLPGSPRMSPWSWTEVMDKREGGWLASILHLQRLVFHRYLGMLLSRWEQQKESIFVLMGLEVDLA